MKRIFIISVIALFAFGVMAADKNDKGTAKAMFYEKNHDFGYIKESKGSVSHEFEFENVGDAPLIIISATGSCGCTRPEYPTKPIKPGKKSKVKVTFNPIGRPGPFRKSVTLKTNGKPKKITLYIDGSVVPNEK